MKKLLGQLIVYQRDGKDKWRKQSESLTDTSASRSLSDNLRQINAHLTTIKAFVYLKVQMKCLLMHQR